MEKDYYILKFYKYVSIDEPEELRKVQHRYCADHGLFGRIKIASEGINGTVSGLKEACNRYMENLRKDVRFSHMTFNVTAVEKLSHSRLHVRVKDEIVNSGFSKEIMPSNDRVGRHYISPEVFAEWHGAKDVVVVDVRSNYEHRLGKFKGAMTFDINTFREFKEVACKVDFDKNKRYVVCCTRAIKSEKARDYLLKVKKLPQVFCLEGGILDYAASTNGAGFEGSCYVFDNRLVEDINKEDPVIVSHCHTCKKPSKRMINCANPVCNVHVPMCKICSQQSKGACSEACQRHPHKRVYDGTGYYEKKANGYNPYIGLKR